MKVSRHVAFGTHVLYLKVKYVALHTWEGTDGPMGFKFLFSVIGPISQVPNPKTLALIAHLHGT